MTPAGEDVAPTFHSLTVELVTSHAAKGNVGGVPRLAEPSQLPGEFALIASLRG